MDKLTAKQRAWIDYYKQGKTAAEAARLAGYRGNNSDVIGSQNVVKLSKYIADRDELLDRDRVADMAEINEFWSDTMRNDKADIKDRLKASELRARSIGAFIERREIVGAQTITVKLLDDDDMTDTD
ncbi:terminase small subunit [Butyricicoccus sp. AM28-25]|jgi:phage terminase small subunit|nr:terminase small subunit [Butyricicoccus sp. AM28-25]RHT78687.1 terminase small subunit [Butyricicoccus sp. AM28-25]DAV09290.1 MAG TPA: Terminase small subunit [Caudoviricetes sp.]